MIANQIFKSRRVALLTSQHQFGIGVGHAAFFYLI